MSKTMPTSTAMTFFYAIAALLAFAGNSVLCRLALIEGEISPASFTVIRLISGAIALWLFVRCTTKAKPFVVGGDWFAAFMLFMYAAFFSFAYVALDTATGALILFGVVQIALLAAALKQGKRLGVTESIGVLLAFLGLLYLLWPQLATPSWLSATFMLVAGYAWAQYTLSGQGSRDPLGDTAGNFVRSLVFVPLLIIPVILSSQLGLENAASTFSVSSKGAWLAVTSGVVTSGMGYALWYAALPKLSTVQAGVIQLLVPVIAAVGGLLFASEIIGVRLMLAALAILGGILLTVLAKGVRQPQSF